MASPNTNTTKSLAKAATSDAQLRKELEKAKLAFKDEKLVDFAIPVAFQKSFGKALFVGVNGTYVNIPVDGQTHQVPEVFANHAQAAINSLT